jgi:cell filamentation protein
MPSRYTATGSQAEFEPGSDQQVLANHLGITSIDEMNDVELDLLSQLYERVFEDESWDRRLTTEDLKSWHREWLGNVYPWAGEIRTVNLGKGSVQFAAAARIPKLLDEFQTQCLDQYTPCRASNAEALVQALAMTHIELILIHPFREGNGRLARLFADVMAVQGGFGLLDYSYWDSNKQKYFAAIQKGWGQDYTDMKIFFSEALP